MKCLLNLLRPKRGQVSVFGLDAANAEVEVKRRLAYVPDQLALYPWNSKGMPQVSQRTGVDSVG